MPAELRDPPNKDDDQHIKKKISIILGEKKMAKNKKATKKFEKKKLKQTIEKRRKVQKFKKSVERRQLKKRLSRNEAKNEEKEDIDLSKNMKTDQKIVNDEDDLINEEIVK
jgi:hypothetical protein